MISDKEFVQVMGIFVKGFLFMVVGMVVIVSLDWLGLLPPPPWLWL